MDYTDSASVLGEYYKDIVTDARKGLGAVIAEGILKICSLVVLGSDSHFFPSNSSPEISCWFTEKVERPFSLGMLKVPA